jgi:enoyl-CoA hydratase
MSFVTTEEQADGVRVLRIDNGKPNAVSTELANELIDALEVADKDADVKAIVIAGSPGMFSAGFDLGTMAKGPAAANEMVKAGGRLGLAVYYHAKPVVAACGGHAIAMGVFLIMVCDYRVGARGSFKLGANETAIGMTLPTFGVEFARAALSKRHFDRAIVQSTIYDPQGAVEAGMLDEIVDPEEVEPKAIEVAARLGALRQPAFRNNKRLVRAPTYELISSTLEENVDRLMPNA